MKTRNVRIVVDAKRSVTAIIAEPKERANDVVVVYAPGAGSNVYDPFGQFLSEGLAERGFTSLRFQFPYMEDKRRTPDRTPVLEAAWRAVIVEARGLGTRFVVGGRSMGGRIASHVVSEDEGVDGLVLYAYPLHAPAKPDIWRDTHFSAITVPTLFCLGTRDGFASPQELGSVVIRMKRATLHVLDDADHGYSVPAASGRQRGDVWQDALEATMSWFREVKLG